MPAMNFILQLNITKRQPEDLFSAISGLLHVPAHTILQAADEIYANRNTMTGSIGVIMQMYDLTGLYDKLGVKEVDIVSGKNKAMGSSGQELTDEQRAILQEYVDESYEQFVEIVSRGRGLDSDTVRELADGRIYTASGALENVL